MAFRVRRGTGFDGERDGLTTKNVLASFCHFHAAGALEWGEAVVQRAHLYAERRQVSARAGIWMGAGDRMAPEVASPSVAGAGAIQRHHKNVSSIR